MPRNEGQNQKNIKIIDFYGMKKGRINYTFSRGVMCKFLSVDVFFQFYVEILDF